jgi:hypothetical protein
MPCWSCGAMSKTSRRSNCKRAPGETDHADGWRYRTRSGRENYACRFQGHPHQAGSLNTGGFAAGSQLVFLSQSRN